MVKTWKANSTKKFQHQKFEFDIQPMPLTPPAMKTETLDYFGEQELPMHHAHHYQHSHGTISQSSSFCMPQSGASGQYTPETSFYVSDAEQSTPAFSQSFSSWHQMMTPDQSRRPSMADIGLPSLRTSMSGSPVNSASMAFQNVIEQAPNNNMANSHMQHNHPYRLSPNTNTNLQVFPSYHNDLGESFWSNASAECHETSSTAIQPNMLQIQHGFGQHQSFDDSELHTPMCTPIKAPRSPYDGTFTIGYDHNGANLMSPSPSTSTTRPRSSTKRRYEDECYHLDESPYKLKRQSSSHSVSSSTSFFSQTEQTSIYSTPSSIVSQPTVQGLIDNGLVKVCRAPTNRFYCEDDPACNEYIDNSTAKGFARREHRDRHSKGKHPKVGDGKLVCQFCQPERPRVVYCTPEARNDNFKDHVKRHTADAKPGQRLNFHPDAAPFVEMLQKEAQKKGGKKAGRKAGKKEEVKNEVKDEKKEDGVEDEDVDADADALGEEDDEAVDLEIRMRRLLIKSRQVYNDGDAGVTRKVDSGVPKGLNH